MSRSHRLFDLIQVLRRHRGTVSGGALARELGVSLRTIRRDIVTLQAMGAHIDGEPGVGYILRPGFVLPPLSFTAEELQALAAGAQWVSRQTDQALARAVQDALAKIQGMLSPDLRRAMDDSPFYVGRDAHAETGVDLARVRRALREQGKMRLTYADEAGVVTERIIWPIMLGFVEGHRYIAGWCELHSAFRVFRVDQILAADFLEERYARNRQQLVKDWRTQEDRPCNRHAAD